MPEYIVDCEHAPIGDGRSLVLPVSTDGHVHERIVRCRDCYMCGTLYPYYCRKWHNHLFSQDGYCHMAVPRGDG